MADIETQVTCVIVKWAQVIRVVVKWADWQLTHKRQTACVCLHRGPRLMQMLQGARAAATAGW